MLELNGVHKLYTSPGETVHAVADVSLSVDTGELVAIYGPSGSGKTTLLSLAAGLIRADAGTVRLDGVDLATLSKREALAHRRVKLGLVSQHFNLTAGMSALENVALPLLLRHVNHQEARERASAMLEEVKLVAKSQRTPERLSGGEQQRVAIARALVGEPRLLLADEPTGNLDSATGDSVLKLLTNMPRSQGASAILVTHDPHVADFADRVLEMRDGKLSSKDCAKRAAATRE
jgi:putative ABC transport system ATP-binding protein